MRDIAQLVARIVWGDEVVSSSLTIPTLSFAGNAGYIGGSPKPALHEFDSLARCFDVLYCSSGVEKSGYLGGLISHSSWVQIPSPRPLKSLGVNRGGTRYKPPLIGLL